MALFLAPRLWLPLLLQAGAAVTPTFHDFAVTRERIAHPAEVRLTDAKDKRYATRLRHFATHPPNFAGHFILASWGCGASCLLTAAINAQTGEVVWLAFPRRHPEQSEGSRYSTVCCWDPGVPKPLEFHADSRLLIIHGSRDETGGGTYDYTFDGKAFTLLKAEETR